MGGESTRPGSLGVGVEQELDRVVPVIESLNSNIDVALSVDTSKPAVMREAVNAGAAMINDVNALRAGGAIDVAAAVGHRLGELVEALSHERSDHRGPVSKRRQSKGNDIHTIKQVRAEPTACDELFEIPIRADDQAGVELLRPIAADRFEYALVDRPQ